MRTIATALVLGFLAAIARAQEETYHFGTDPGRTTITFESKTEVMTIVGATRVLQGSATVDPKAGKVAASLVVPVASLDTGYPARDRVLRSKAWLDGKTHPTLEFRASKGTAAGANAWRVEGEFTMRGVARPLALDVEVRPIPESLARKFDLGPGSWIRAKTRFTLRLSDFGIRVPEASIAQVNDEWSVAVELFGTTAPPETAASAPARDDEAPDPKFATREIALRGAPGVRYRFGGKPQHTAIAWVAEGESGTVVARTVTMSGVVAIDAEKGTAALAWSVPLESFSTGAAASDAAFRARLRASEHPFVDFESTGAVRGVDGRWTIEGDLALGGGKRRISLTVGTKEISAETAKAQRWGEQPGIKFTTEFPVRLAEFAPSPEGSAGLPDAWTVRFDAVALREP